LRILLIHQYFLEPDDPGGSRFNEMARIWTENGHSVTVLAGMIHANKAKKRPEYKGKYFFYSRAVNRSIPHIKIQTTISTMSHTGEEEPAALTSSVILGSMKQFNCPPG